MITAAAGRVAADGKTGLGKNEREMYNIATALVPGINPLCLRLFLLFSLLILGSVLSAKSAAAEETMVRGRFARLA